MKKVALISAIALSGLFYNAANAQIRIGFGLHINTPVVRVVEPAPVYTEYREADQYYYLPDVDAYYSVYEHCYYYNDGVRWVPAAYLPGEYRNYDWRNVRRYEVRAPRPYLNANIYRERYRGNVRQWDRYRDDRNYANRDFNRPDRRDDGPRFERHSEYRGAEHADNRGWDNGYRRDDRNDDRGSYDRSQPGRGQDNYGQQQQPGRGQGGYQQGQQQQPGRGGDRQDQQPQQNQPSRQNGNSGPRGGGDEHFAAYRGQAHASFRM